MVKNDLFFDRTTIVHLNCCRSYKNKTGKMRPILEALRPLMPFTALFVITTTWVLLSKNDICSLEPRLMFLLFGTIFSNICVSFGASSRHKPILNRFFFKCCLVSINRRTNVGYPYGRMEHILLATFGSCIHFHISLSVFWYERYWRGNGKMVGIRIDNNADNRSFSLWPGHCKFYLIFVPLRQFVLKVFLWFLQVREMCRHFKIKCFKVRESISRSSSNNDKIN